jgi:hypothetical protein
MKIINSKENIIMILLSIEVAIFTILVLFVKDVQVLRQYLLYMSFPLLLTIFYKLYTESS